jgi:Tol biopolymer transport system component
MKFNASLDRIALGVLLVLAVLVTLTILFGEGAGVRVHVDLPANGEVGPYQTIEFKFSEPIDSGLASDLISLDPVHEGYLQWVNDTTLRFVPLKPYEHETVYTVILNAGEVAINGREVKKQQAWEFTIREPLVAYLVTDGVESSIWAVDLNGGVPKRLTDAGIRVISFDTAQSGDFIAFTSINTQGGIDLWRVRRDGSGQSILLDCGMDRCTTPAIAPNGTRIAYSHEAAGPGPELPFGSPRIWLLDLNSGQNSPVYGSQLTLGYNPTWSPDSNKLASFDGLADRINLLDLEEKQQFVFPSNTGGPITFSPDSTKMLFTTVEQKEDGLRTQVRLADLPLNESLTLIGLNDERDYSYYSLAWSSLEHRAVLGFRASDEQPAQILWVFNPGLLDGIVITSDPQYAYNSPQWDPWGKALIFQQFKLRGAYNPEIGLWRDGSIESIILTKGLMPHWLP